MTARYLGDPSINRLAGYRHAARLPLLQHLLGPDDCLTLDVNATIGPVSINLPVIGYVGQLSVDIAQVNVSGLNSLSDFSVVLANGRLPR